MYALIRSPLVVFAGVALAAQVCSSCASADPAGSGWERQVEVKTHGLDLTSPSDQALLAHRIELAAREVCGLFDGGVSTQSPGYADCHAQAVGDALRQMQVLVARATSRTEMARLASAHAP